MLETENVSVWDSVLFQHMSDLTFYANWLNFDLCTVVYVDLEGFVFESSNNKVVSEWIYQSWPRVHQLDCAATSHFEVFNWINLIMGQNIARIIHCSVKAIAWFLRACTACHGWGWRLASDTWDVVWDHFREGVGLFEHCLNDEYDELFSHR